MKPTNESTGNLELSYRRAPDHLSVDVSGQWTTNDAKAAIDAMREEADRHSLHQLLIDVRKMSRPDSEITRFFTGEHFAKVLHRPYKSAVVVKPEIYNKFAENVAVNRGAMVAVFFEEDEAMKWLLK